MCLHSQDLTLLSPSLLHRAGAQAPHPTHPLQGRAALEPGCLPLGQPLISHKSHRKQPQKQRSCWSQDLTFRVCHALPVALLGMSAVTAPTARLVGSGAAAPLPHSHKPPPPPPPQQQLPPQSPHPKFPRGFLALWQGFFLLLVLEHNLGVYILGFAMKLPLPKTLVR